MSVSPIAMLTPSQAARLLGITPDQLPGVLKRYRIGPHDRYRLADVLALSQFAYTMGACCSGSLSGCVSLVPSKASLLPVLSLSL